MTKALEAVSRIGKPNENDQLSDFVKSVAAIERISASSEPVSEEQS